MSHALVEETFEDVSFCRTVQITSCSKKAARGLKFLTIVSSENARIAKFTRVYTLFLLKLFCHCIRIKLRVPCLYYNYFVTVRIKLSCEPGVWLERVKEMLWPWMLDALK